MEINWLNFLVASALMCLAWVLTQVLCSCMVIDHEVMVCHLIKCPEVPHFKQAYALLLDGTIYDAYHTRIIDMNMCQGLWVSKFLED